MASLVRCWLIRGLIVAVLAAGGFGAWVAVHWVSPETVRQAVLDHMRETFGESAKVSVESAAVRIFGGIRVTNLTLTHPGEKTPFAVIPSAVIYHDKQEMNRGKLSVRKVELESPTLRLTRQRDGTWSLPKLPESAADAGRPAPTVVVRDATVLLTDADPDGFPPLALKNIKLHLVNDPQPVIKVDGQCSLLPANALDEAGRVVAGPDGFVIPLTVTAKWERAAKQLTAHVDVPDVALRPELGPALGTMNPTLARVVGGLSGQVGVKVDLTTTPGGGPPAVGVRVDLRNCRFADELLPKPLEQLGGTIQVRNGRVTADKLTGKLGTATVELALETRPLFGPSPVTFGPRVRPLTPYTQLRPPPDHAPPADHRESTEQKLERFDLTVRGLTLEDELVAKLAPNGEKWRRQYQPVGGVDVRVAFTRPDGGWRREVDIIPNRTTVTYEKFPHPVTDLDGWVKSVTASDGTDEVRVRLTGKLGDRWLNVSGVVAGEGPDPHVALRIVGTDIPIDDKLIGALPPKYAAALTKMRAGGRGDVVVDVRQAFGVNRLENTFRVRVYDGRVNYLHFPYALTRIRGNVLVRVVASDADRPVPVAATDEDTDRVELRNFEAVHDGGRLWLSGESAAVPGTPDRKLTLRVQGENCPIDDAFRAGLTELKLDGAIRTLAPRGEITFGADVDIWDRGKRAVEFVTAQPGLEPATAKLPAEPPFNPVTDLKLAFNFKGPTVTPSFFKYELNQLAGVLRYQGGRVELVKFTARHGASEVKLDAGEVRFGEGGGVWANLGGASVSPLVPDAALLRALPPKLRAGFEELNLRGGADLTVKHLVVKVPGGMGELAARGPEPVVARGQAPAGPIIPRTLTPPAVLPPLPSSFPTPTPTPALPTAPAPPASITIPSAEPSPADSTEPVIYWNAELKLRDAALDAGQPWDELTGLLAAEGRHEGNRLGLVTGTLWLDKAMVAKQPLTAVRVPFRIAPQEPDPKRPGEFLPPAAEVRNLSAALFQGTVGGQARVVLADPVRYRLYLTASGVKLDELARHYKLAGGAELSGRAQGAILLENRPDGRDGKLVPVGGGQIDVPQGRMYNLPVLLDLVKVLKGQQPDGCAFEEAHATFDLRGDRVRVTQLDLLGSAVSLGGAGELDTDGKHVQFEFYTIWSQTLKRWLTTPLGDVTGMLSGSLFKIELTRENGKLTPKAVMLPVVTDPVRNVAERLRNRFAPTPAAPGVPPTARAAPGR